jgi:tRNA threonylcarbamoyladenosine biosynthesis protein TsaB
MGLILNIDTSTTMCSVALAKDGLLIAVQEQDGDYTHAENLTVFIQSVLENASLTLSDIEAVAVSKGPGSYTGLRIGVSTAKGICYSLNKPLIAVDTLQALAYGVSAQKNEKILYCPMLDARRMEVYTAVFDASNNSVHATSAEIIDERSFLNLLNNSVVCFFGNGAEKCKEVLSQHKNALFVDGCVTSAKNMVTLSEKAYVDSIFEDVAYFEPFYLKDFVAGKKKKETL